MSITFIEEQEVNLTYIYQRHQQSITHYHTCDNEDGGGADYVNYGMFGHCSLSLHHYQ